METSYMTDFEAMQVQTRHELEHIKTGLLKAREHIEAERYDVAIGYLEGLHESMNLYLPDDIVILKKSEYDYLRGK